MPDKQMNEAYRYALAINILHQITMREDLDIELRYEISEALVQLNNAHLELFDKYMRTTKRLESLLEG
jgi:hypothetical protein